MEEAKARDIEIVKILNAQESKLHFFLITIALGVLAFSIEMFDYTRTHNYVFILIFAWLNLLISVLSGIFQIQWRIVVQQERRYLEAKQRDYETLEKASNGLANLFKSESLGKYNADEINTMISDCRKNIENMAMDIKSKSDEVYVRSKIHEWSLVTGLILLAAFKILNTPF